jgi:hypothetical protein
LDLSAQLLTLDDMLLSNVKVEFPDPLDDSEKVAINAYLVLTHACIEEFAGQVFLDHFDRLSQLSQFPITPASANRFALAVAFALPEGMRATMPYKTRTLAGMLKAGRRAYATSYISTNDGLKQRI